MISCTTSTDSEYVQVMRETRRKTGMYRYEMNKPATEVCAWPGSGYLARTFRTHSLAIKLKIPQSLPHKLTEMTENLDLYGRRRGDHHIYERWLENLWIL